MKKKLTLLASLVLVALAFLIPQKAQGTESSSDPLDKSHVGSPIFFHLEKGADDTRACDQLSQITIEAR